MRLLVAFDGSEGARAALREAAVLARETGGTVALVHVLRPLLDAADVVAPTTQVAMVTVTAEARSMMEAAVVQSGLDAAKVDCLAVEVERGEDEAEALERIAAQQAATMVVISSRRVASVTGVLLGSVAGHVIRHAPCPVLVVRE